MYVSSIAKAYIHLNLHIYNYIATYVCMHIATYTVYACMFAGVCSYYTCASCQHPARSWSISTVVWSVWNTQLL